MQILQRFLVTGATGLNGSAVLREFSRHNHPVRALVRNRWKIGSATLDAMPTVEFMVGDMSQPDTVDPALKGITRVLMISSTSPQMRETQCTFVEACKSAGVRHIVKFSGAESGIGFDPTKFRFTRMHEEIERYLEESGLAWTHLRPCQFMQVYLREAPTISAQNAMFLPFDQIRLSPIDIEDIAKIAYTVLTEEGHEAARYEMTGPEALTMTEIAERISEVVGKTVRFVPVTPEERSRSLLAKGAPPEFVAALDEQTAERLKWPGSRISLTTHARFGVRPTTFAEFARRNAAVFRGESSLRH